MTEQRALTRIQVPKELVGLKPAGSYSFDELYRLAQVCHESGMWEDTLDTAQAMIKILRGQELGLPPTAAMAGFDIIRKRLFLKPWIAAAMINSCGYGAYRVVIQNLTECVIVFKRKVPGEGWQDCPPVRYSIEEAAAQGLTEKRAGEGRVNHWKASPANMLYQRCMGRGAAIYFPELLAGIPVSQEDEKQERPAKEQLIAEITGRGDYDATPRQLPQPPSYDLARDSDLFISPDVVEEKLHPLWSKIEQKYIDAGKHGDYAKYCSWACRRMMVSHIKDIPTADLEKMAEHVFVTLEPLVADRMKEEALERELHAAADRDLAEEERALL